MKMNLYHNAPATAVIVGMPREARRRPGNQKSNSYRGARPKSAHMRGHEAPAMGAHERAIMRECGVNGRAERAEKIAESQRAEYLAFISTGGEARSIRLI